MQNELLEVCFSLKFLLKERIKKEKKRISNLNYTANNKELVMERNRQANKKFYSENKVKVLAYQSKYRAKKTKEVDDIYVRLLIRSQTGISKKQLKLQMTPQQYEEVRQSILLKRQFYSLKSKT
jgi:hypothetical protein